MHVSELVEQKILQSPEQRISFASYMDTCLYAPGVGYYTSNRIKIGKEGDFYTSSNIGSLMGEMLAQSIIRMFDERASRGQSLLLIEWGGGTGRLAAQVLDEIKATNESLYAKTSYYSAEKSPYHEAIQADQLINHSTHIVSDLGQIDEGAYVVGWANELFDAFPCRRFRRGVHTLEEMYVGWDSNSPYPIWVEVDQACAMTYASIWQSLQPYQQFERIVGLEEWFNHLQELDVVDSLIIIDYGAEFEDLVAPHRMNGTFICYHNHQAADEPFLYLGEQDMTAHVDFTQVRQFAYASGFKNVEVISQKQFLLEAGLMARIQSHAGLDPFHPIVKRNRAIRQLLLSDQMSELFKVCIAHKY
jgi:SAM-dependent MidA family methyltransferase